MSCLQKKIFTGALWLIGGMASILMQSAIASPEQERVYLLQLLHQINAMQPTILAAEQVQSKTDRVQFHYTAYVDGQGQPHNGVWEDLQLIRTGIQAHLNPAPLEPRAVDPISGDYRDGAQLLSHQEAPKP